MSLLRTAWRRQGILYNSSHLSVTSRNIYYASRPFAESDHVLLRPSDQSASPFFIKSLELGQVIHTHLGRVDHSEIIGKQPRDAVKTKKGGSYRLQHASLSDYVLWTRRLVTPIYPADANLIVSLLDLTVEAPEETDTPPEQPEIQILEAGTGHGSLTLHLARAIHGANPPIRKSTESDEGDNPTSIEHDSTDQVCKSQRRAVLHSIDKSANFSKHARKIVHGFRKGLYAGDVDFHVGDVGQWVKDHQASLVEQQKPTQFLTHAFLDMPDIHQHLETVASAMCIDAMLIVFNPSITQIAECLKHAKQYGIPLHLDRVLELGNNGASGGREWDVRTVVPRSISREETPSEQSESSDGEAEGLPAPVQESADDKASRLQDMRLVCRPKVYERIHGGGFVGVFRRKTQDQPTIS